MTIDNNYDKDGLRWRTMLILSLILHGLFFSALFWVPGNNSATINMNEVIEVNLRDMSKDGLPKGKISVPRVQQSEKKAASVDSKKARRISPASRENTVSFPKRNARIIDSKPKSQVSSNRLLDNVISKIKNKDQTEKNTDYLDRTIAALDKKAGTPEGTKAGRGASENSLAMNIYKMKVETLIKSQWAYSDALGKYEAIVAVKIRKDGTVLNINFIKPSRNSVFDKSVLTAIEQAKPLPPLPEEYEKNYEDIEIKFNLKDFE